MRIPDQHLRAVAIFLFGMCFGSLLMAPTPFTEGNVVQVDDRLYALVVSSGIRSPASSVIRNAGGDLGIEQRTVDAVHSSVLAMAAARDLVGLGNTQSLLLDPVEGRAGWDAGLRPGDLVTRISFDDPTCPNRVPDSSLMDLWSELKRCTAELTLRRDGISLRIRVDKGMTYAVEAVLLRGSTPGEIASRLARSNGNSAGLPLALHYADVLSPGELFSFDVVAATGAISPHSRSVLEIGGLLYKAEAAAKAGATVLLVPLGQVDEVDPALGIEVHGVDTLDDAIAFLCARGAADALCTTPLPVGPGKR